MDYPVKISNASLFRGRARRRRGRKMGRNYLRSPSRHLGVVKQIKKKNKRKKRKISGQCFNSVVQCLYNQNIPLLNVEEQRNLLNIDQRESNILEQTIDLCDDDGSVADPSSSVTTVPFLPNENPSQTLVIDLSDDFPTKKEVVDVKETEDKPVTDLKPMLSCQPKVIDICDVTTKENPNPKLDNDDIFVIGTFTNTQHLHRNSNKWSNFKSLVTCSEKLKRKYLKKPSVLDKIDRNANQDSSSQHWLQKNLTKVGENVYVNSPVTLPSNGLRPIIIDGSNVAFVHSNCNFSSKRLEICINYFKEKGHKVTAFVPQFRLSSHRNDNPELLRRLEKQGDVVLTPSKKIDGRNIVPYDDRFIVQTAVLKGGIIVTRDNYNDLLKENPAWAETIKYRTLAFTWVDDVLMFPKDPLGEYGPSLEQFLRFN